MTAPSGDSRVKVGVVLRPAGDDLHAWLREASALDAAGADALWIDLADRPDIDPAAVVAALAMVTTRAELIAPQPGDAADRIAVTLDRLSRGRVRRQTDLDDGWEHTGVPESRTAWREAHRGATERGRVGLLVPADPRLVDLLRNPDEPGERDDLHLAVG